MQVSEFSSVALEGAEYRCPDCTTAYSSASAAAVCDCDED